MKSIVFCGLYFMLLLATPAFNQSGPEPGGILLGIFDGRTPCQELAVHLREKASPECIKIKWRLTLYQDKPGSTEGDFEILGLIYKRDKPGNGRWKTIRGTPKNPEAVVFKLQLPGRPPLYLQQGDDNIFFFLDQDKQLMVGNRDFSYTLNRINKQL